MIFCSVSVRGGRAARGGLIFVNNDQDKDRGKNQLPHQRTGFLRVANGMQDVCAQPRAWLEKGRLVRHARGSTGPNSFPMRPIATKSVFTAMGTMFQNLMQVCVRMQARNGNWPHGAAGTPDDDGAASSLRGASPFH